MSAVASADMGPDEVMKYRRAFAAIDSNGSGTIDSSELALLLKQCGEKVPLDSVHELIREADTNGDNVLDFEEFIQCLKNVRKTGKSKRISRIVDKALLLNVLAGVTESSSHSFSEEERYSFSEHCNYALGDSDFHTDKGTIPLDCDSDDIFTAVADGLVLIDLVNHAVPDTIDERSVNRKKKLNAFEIGENLQLAIQSARGIGVNVTNVGPDDFKSGNRTVILGVMWQIVKIGLLTQIDLKHSPHLFRLLEEGEALEDLLRLSPEQLLLRWVNYHLSAAGVSRRMKNFGRDVQDSEIYTYLLAQLAPNACTRKPLENDDMSERAEAMLVGADAIGCRRYVRPKDIVAGNSKLNLAFVANLFNTHPGLEPLEEEDIEGLDDLFDDETQSREARSFMAWMNSLGAADPAVTNLFEDLRSGLVLLRLEEIVEGEGTVVWRKVEMKPTSVFKKSSNCVYAVQIGKGMGFSLVGIGGKDIADGNKKLTLALVWQLLRQYLVNLVKVAGGGKALSDRDILKWANTKVKEGGSDRTIKSFKDKALTDSLFIADLLKAIDPKAINDDYLVQDPSDEEKTENAKYVISSARKIGCGVFALHDDITQGDSPKLMLAFFAACMVRAAN